MRRAFSIGATLLFSMSVKAHSQRGGRPVTTIQQGEACPEGTTEIRPRSCMAPDLPAPSILDYRPRSTLVTPEHLVRVAKYPAIDFHGHPEGLLDNADGLARLGSALDSLNVRIMVAADNMSGERLQHAIAAIRESPKMKDRVRVLAGIDFRNVGPGWAEKAIAQLHADLNAGAVGVGEISKSFGLSIRKPDGSDSTIPRSMPCGTNALGSASRCLFIPRIRSSSSSPSTTPTSDGSSWRSSLVVGIRRTGIPASKSS